MAKLENCQFVEIRIDNEVIAGASEEEKYKNWMEGYASSGLSMQVGQHGVHFDSSVISVLTTKGSGTLIERYLKQGYKKIVITVVHCASNEHGQDYEIQRTVYSDCDIRQLSLDMEANSSLLFTRIYFTFGETIEVTFNLPNASDTGLDKVGPIKYSIPERKLK